MRYFNCHVFMYINDKFTKSQSTACWSMLEQPVYFSEKLINNSYDFMKEKTIYIDNFTELETIEYQDLIVSIINEITECQFHQRLFKRYIKFRLLETYDQSLVLLNFIRNLWYEPKIGYSKIFFEKLKIAEHKDPLQRLTWANKEACHETIYPPGHSNYFPRSMLAIKTKEDLFNFKDNRISVFLTGK